MALRSFFGFCVESGSFKENPARLIRSSPTRTKEPSALVALLALHFDECATQGNCGPNSPVFRSKSGRCLGARQIQLNFARWLSQAGITRPFSIHSLRHTFAMRLYRKTGDLCLVQRALGHRQITTTEIYVRVNDETAILTLPGRPVW